MNNNKSRININYKRYYKDLDRSRDKYKDKYNYRSRSRDRDIDIDIDTHNYERNYEKGYSHRDRYKNRNIDTHNYERNYEKGYSHTDRYKNRNIDTHNYERNYERGYSHTDRYKNRDEIKYENRSISRPRNRNYNDKKTDYINDLIKFNKKELYFNNVLEASNCFVTIVEDALNDNNNDFNGKNLSMLFVGAKKYNIKYNNWKNDKSTIFQILISKINLVNSQGISNILNSLSKMNIKWTDFNNDLQNNLIESVEHNVNQFNHQEIANTLLALYQLGLKWTNFNNDLQNNLIESVEYNINQFNDQSIANTLLALYQLGLKWTNFNNDLQNNLIGSVEHNVNKFIPQGIANTLLALYQLGLKWTNFNNDLQNNLIGSVEHNVNKFNPQGIANTLLALVEMRVSINELCILKLLKIININFNDIVNDEIILQIGQVLTRILLTNYRINLSDEGKVIVNQIKGKNDKVNLEIRESDLQNDVFRILKKLDKDIEMEYKCGIWACISVDIYIKNSNTVIEVNGPHHFDFKNEYNLKTLRKRELLIELGFNYIDISYKEWIYLNNDEEKLFFLKTKLSV
jgi:hypothetical protein